MCIVSVSPATCHSQLIRTALLGRAVGSVCQAQVVMLDWEHEKASQVPALSVPLFLPMGVAGMDTEEAQ